MAASAEGTKEEETIIPGLPDKVAVRCLALVHRNQHPCLRRVCTQWRSLFTRGLSSVHALRHSTLHLTQSYLVLFPREYYMAAEASKPLPYFEIHARPPNLPPIISQKSLCLPLRAGELPSLCSHACISMGPFILLLGGAHMGPKPLNSLHIFDTMSRAWWHGANMQFPRSDFAWGVIKDHLYVAGGYADEDVGHIQHAEVYDFDADQWSRLPDMPARIAIDLFFVHKGALYVRGYACECTDFVLKLYSYNPSSNEWTDKNWMLSSVLKDVRPLTTNKITALQEKEDDTLYMLEVKEGERVDYDELPACLKVLKLAPDSLEWETKYKVIDVAHLSLQCPCSEAIYRDVTFPSIGKKVVVMDHLESCDSDEDDEMTLQMTEASEVLKLSLICPSRWDVVVVEA